MHRAVKTIKTWITPALCADMAGMLALSVIVFGCLHLPTLL